MNKLLADSPTSWNEIDVADRCNKYKDFLEMFIIESGMTVAEDYPEASHKDIVQRALQRKKPFKADGSTGYRDYLVWLTCLETARRYTNEEIHFISSNTRDFADPNDKEKLHSDLLSDLVEWKISDTRFYFWNSLKSFIDKYAKTKFDVIEAQEVLVAEIEKNEAGFLTPVQDYINSKVIGCSLEAFSNKTKQHIQILFAEFGNDKFFGRTEVMKALKITASPSSELIKKMLESELIYPMKGKGKGKYLFKRK